MRGSREPSPELDSGRVGPVQVVDHQHNRPRGGLVYGERDELLGQQGGNVGAAVGGDLAAEQAGDRGPPGVRGWRPHLERVEEREQRELLAKLVPGPPEDLAVRRRLVARTSVRLEPMANGRECSTNKGGLADA